MEKKTSYKLIIIGLTIFGVICTLILFIYYMPYFMKTFEIEGAEILFMLFIFIICVLSLMAVYTFRQWFKQEELYITDIPSRFGFFFLFYTFGKAFDLLWYYVYFELNKVELLILLKIRFYIIIFMILPIISLSIELTLYYLSLKENFSDRLGNRKDREKLGYRITFFITAVEVFIVTIIPDTLTLSSIVLPVLAFVSLTIIIWMFYFAYKQDALKNANPLILTIGFIGLLASQIIRGVGRVLIGEWSTASQGMLYGIITETIGLIVFIVIFVGFVKK
jgi:hypothetical protein